MSNLEYLEKLRQEKQRTREFRDHTSTEQMVKFFSEIDFDFLRNAHKEVLLYLLWNGKCNIFQLKKHLSSKKITQSYGHTYKVVHQLEEKGYLKIYKIKGSPKNEKEVKLVTANIFDLFVKHHRG